MARRLATPAFKQFAGRMKKQVLDIREAARPALLRRLAAIFYDLWLIAALWLLGAMADTVIRTAIGGTPGEGQHWLLQLYMALTPPLFFTWFWTHGGQTLGMRAWRIRLVNDQGANVSTAQALRRCLWALPSLALFGFGLIWVIFDENKAAWHDRASQTWLVMLSRKREQKSTNPTQ